MSETLRFAPSILARLGEELVSHPDQGIVELVKNAYDADALLCQVTLSETTQHGGKVIVCDDGDGMTPQQISDGWLVVGRSEKDPRERTRLGRLPVGEKGLGRLAALRLGQRVVLETRPRDEPGTEYRMEIDWALFDHVQVVEDVTLEIEKRSTSARYGTSITISNLMSPLGRMDTKRLARSLILLADPFESQRSFSAELISDDFRDLEQLVRRGYFNEAHHRLRAELHPDGRGSAAAMDHRGNVKWKADHRDLGRSRTYRSPQAVFELWEFTLNVSAFSGGPATVGEVRNWLQEVGGVHLYHRGLRVHPYGDRGHDWLEMNLRRVRSPEERPSTNNSIGLVTVDDPGEMLIAKTDRSGFIENDAFSELQEFCGDALDWMAKRRVAERDRKRRKQRKRGRGRRQGAIKDVEEAVAGIPENQRKGVREAVERLNRESNSEREAILSDLQLYRTLSTVGTTASVFAHEADGPLTRIGRLARAIERRGKKVLGDAYADNLEKQVGLLQRAAQGLRSFVRVPLAFLQLEKRRVGVVEIHQVIDGVIELFDPFLDDFEVTVKTEYVDTSPRIWGRRASLESIMANLITNAIRAFQHSETLVAGRELKIFTVESGSDLLISVRDNGPGIRGIGRADIWSPGQTTTPGGTGIGLTIVRDEAADLGGSAHLVPNNGRKGAEFVVRLPLFGVK